MLREGKGTTFDDGLNRRVLLQMNGMDSMRVLEDGETTNDKWANYPFCCRLSGGEAYLLAFSEHMLLVLAFVVIEIENSSPIHDLKI